MKEILHMLQNQHHRFQDNFYEISAKGKSTLEQEEENWKIFKLQKFKYKLNVNDSTTIGEDVNTD